MVRKVRSMPDERVLDQLQDRLECILAYRHPDEVARLFQRICECEVDFLGAITAHGISAVLEWSEKDLDGYCSEALREML